jgi:hypothetical protein
VSVDRGRARRIWRAGALATTITGVATALALSAGPAAAAGGGIDCQPFSSTPCLLPFPNDLFTKANGATVTGRRVHLPQGAMPVGTSGPIDVAPYDRNDGFDPGSTIIARVPGLDNPQAFERTNPVQLRNIARFRLKRAPIVLIDARTHRRQPIWVELDSTAPDTASTTLLIHPAKLLTEGHRFIVALRNLRDASGHKLSAPAWFEKLRDSKRLPKRERSQRKRYRSIFRSLAKAHIRRHSLYEAWDFTVESRRSLTAPMLHIRNAAFRRLGDNNLADNVARGHAPAFTVNSVTTTGLPPGIAEQITGTFQVPCYLTSPSCAIGGAFNYNTAKPYRVPTQKPGNMATAPFKCTIPTAASSSAPARAMIYGHGLFGSDAEATNGAGGNQAAIAADHNFMSCGTEWWGLAGDTSGEPGTENDIPHDIGVAQDLNLFPTLGDRLEQSMLNTLYLGRLMRRPDGFASDPAFQDGSSNLLFSTSHLYYYGNSLGGIMGGATTATAPDLRRSAIGVPGTDFGGLLLQRSTDFVGSFDVIVKSSYAPAQYTLILDLIEQLWDRADAEGYAQHMTSNPLPDTPSHKVLMHVAYGDHQVSMYAAAVEARTIGAKAYEPQGSALDPSRSRDAHLLFGVERMPRARFNGSGIVIWDSGPGRVNPPPFTNAPPTTATDPHSDPRETVAARSQISTFLNDNGGRIADVCGNSPCHTDAFVP